jgi:hypothetical protein
MIMLGFRMSMLEIDVPDPQIGPADAVSGSQPLDPTREALGFNLTFNLDTTTFSSPSFIPLRQ